LKSDKKVADRFFKGMGPLSSFSARIDMAYLLGLLGDDHRYYMSFHSIRKIRNLFAHTLAPIDFSSSEIKKEGGGLIDPLGTAMALKEAIAPYLGKHGKELRNLVRFMSSVLEGCETLRGRYMATIQMGLFLLRLIELEASWDGTKSVMLLEKPRRKKLDRPLSHQVQGENR